MPGWTSKLVLFASGVMASLLFAAVAALAVSYGGLYNVAATERDTALADWFLRSTMQQSVRARARSAGPSAAFTEQQVLAGSGDFSVMCAMCHGAPGQERGEVGKGLNPQPPSLSNASDRWSRAELFWIVKNGVRMTGMPAFGPTHSDEALWNIVAFVQAMRGMTSEQYRDLIARARQSGDGVHPRGAQPAASEHQPTPPSTATEPPPEDGHEHRH